ncbi:acylneuraminate cytidylyltransferase [Dysgonomonas capnocytophagoides]|uniref:N-acylneuraminate cytidylyltransferase n=1 Tax=Dysgonomonas capnocytophagoides TaxID=45254 RepID=A0A4Y8KX04_9BACT|nr:acylneuraminate cytidylyltransferase [Dysgonomonas capnocytophagoides]TFD93181.1 acylneuraminate cytidylyltransferase [Dysgonomonas capnocytophagoides]
MGKVIAFIPVRGGSKSIPLKNIKLFCGKPLVYWNIAALQAANSVTQIVIATDSQEIEDVVKSFEFDKVLIYRRSEDNAQDTSSTESVMIEYINVSNLLRNDIFMLVQATSPLTKTNYFVEALRQYCDNDYDSLLTCVRNYRFFWNEDGTSKNYDYKNRPRRQDFKGQLMENGAFYINTVGNILDSGNRLSGKIGIYEMPDYTASEIDEPDDWIILENLMQKYVLSRLPKKKIKLFLSDVDGVLTDAGMYYSENGDELKKFNTHDGMGFRLLKDRGIKTGIITSENTYIVERRAQKLNIDYLCQGKREGGKLAAALEICKKEGFSLSEVAYIGDDINCFDILSSVGLPACPADALGKIKNIPGIMCLKSKGGDGVVREFVEYILERCI